MEENWRMRRFLLLCFVGVVLSAECSEKGKTGSVSSFDLNDTVGWCDSVGPEKKFMLNATREVIKCYGEARKSCLGEVLKTNDSHEVLLVAEVYQWGLFGPHEIYVVTSNNLMRFCLPHSDGGMIKKNVYPVRRTFLEKVNRETGRLVDYKGWENRDQSVTYDGSLLLLTIPKGEKFRTIVFEPGQSIAPTVEYLRSMDLFRDLSVLFDSD